MRLIRSVILLVASAGAFANPCKKAHDAAEASCSAYEHSIDADQLGNISPATKKRMAETESLKLFSMGRACAKAQKKCIQACENALGLIGPDEDMSAFIEHQNNCSQGSVAEHRSNLAKRYLSMKNLSDSTRDPATDR